MVNDLFREVQKIVLSDDRKSTMKDRSLVRLEDWDCCDYCYLLLLIFWYRFLFQGSMNTFTKAIETLIANYLLNVKKSNTLTMEEVYKKKLDIMSLET